MKRSDPAAATFLLDNNVFVSAIMDPARETATLRLILEMIRNKDIALVGNEFLAEEMARYAESFRSETAALLLHALLTKMTIIDVQERFTAATKSTMGTEDPADILHAATCLQTGATLITNDHHYDNIRDQGIIKVWSTTQAIQNLL
jgi:predicted nucleic acid-binding protein